MRPRLRTPATVGAPAVLLSAREHHSAARPARAGARPARRWRRRFLVAAALVAVLVVSISGTPITRSGSSDWADGSSHGQWQVVFSGYGSVRGADGGDSSVTLSPQAPRTAAETHAALVVSRQQYSDFFARVTVQVGQQLRSPHPNAWEVGWVLWHYTARDHFYALTLKPTGWELSKQDPSYAGGQRFLASGLAPQFPVGQQHTLGIVQVGPEITVSADDQLLARVRDDVQPYLTGAMGLYVEDAQATFTLRDAHVLTRIPSAAGTAAPGGQPRPGNSRPIPSSPQLLKN